MTRRENDGQRPGGGTSPRRTTTTRAPRDKVKPRTSRLPTVGDAADEGDTKTDRQRIAKLMARVGLCSRRDAEAWILEGRVSVNGMVLSSPAIDVGTNDRVLVDGAPLPAADKTRLFLFHKPRGLITSDHDPEGRATVFDHLRDHWPDGPRVVTVGRLDINTEGLLLLTNDGGLARVLELPQTGWVRRYRVRAKGETDQAILDRLADGINVDGVDYAGIEAKLDRVQGANCWLTMGLREGKNREVKKVLEHIGLEVNRLIRLSFGPFQLLDLPEGEVSEVRTRILRDQLGPVLAAQAGVDFTEIEVAPIVPAPTRTARDSARKPFEKKTFEKKTGDKKSFDRSSEARSSAAAPRGRNFRDRDRDDEIVAPEKRERPEAGPRKHVATLRAETAVATRTGPRLRRERTGTTDRKNRPVVVERLIAQTPAPAIGRRARPDRRDGPDQGLRRERSETAPRRERSEAAPRRERSEIAPRRERADAAPRRERSDAAPRRERSDAAPRRERSDAAPRRERSDAAPRRERSDAAPRRERSDAAPRRERSETAPRRERPAFGERRDRSPDSATGHAGKTARVSQSALGKRERIARSGGPARDEGDRFKAERSEGGASRRVREDATRPRSAKPFVGKPARGRSDERSPRRSESDKPARSRSPDGGKTAGPRPARGGAGGKPPRAPSGKPASRGSGPPRRPRS